METTTTTSGFPNNVYELRIRDRVRLHSTQETNEKIDRETLCNILNYSTLSTEEIKARIEELNQEWDIDRALMATSSVLGGVVLLRSLFKKKALGLLGVQLSFLLYYAAKGWCPPLPLLRRLGFRTKSEIEAEKSELLKLI